MRKAQYSAEEMEALEWLAYHQDDPLVADASIPGEHHRDGETGEGLDPSHGIFSYVPHGHRRMLMLDAFYDGWAELANIEEQVVPHGLTPTQLDTQVRVGRAMRRLTPEQREVLRMYYLERMTLAAIGDEKGTAYESKQKQLSRARRSLARAIDDTWDEPYNLMEEVTGTAGPVTPEAALLLVRLFGNTPEDYEEWDSLTERNEA
jgi:hypothetical protein